MKKNLVNNIIVALCLASGLFLLSSCKFCEKMCGSGKAKSAVACKTEDCETAEAAEPTTLDLANEGDAESQFRMAMKCMSGEGVEKDKAAAIEWCRKAAEQGHAGAQCYYACMHSKGKVMEPKYDVALKWYRLAAEQGVASSMSNLGDMYAAGQGVPKDEIEAYIWYNAAATTMPDVQAYKSARDNMAAKLTPLQLAAAEAIIEERKQK